MPLTPNPASRRRAGARLGLALALAWTGAGAAMGEEVTAVFAQTAPGYVRKKAPDGHCLPETYTLGEGGPVPGTAIDTSVDRLNFIDLAKLVTGPLEAQNYHPVPDRDPNRTQLLVMVYWGTTRGPDDANANAATQEVQAHVSAALKPPPPIPTAGSQAGPSRGNAADRSAALPAARQGEVDGALATLGLENHERERTVGLNAQLLGYDCELGPSAGGFGAAENRRADLIGELEEPRYFIVLMAYDFDGLWRHGRHTLLWVTRFSVRARDTHFDGVAAAMVAQASHYFGGNTGGLRRETLPEGRVDIGAVKSLGEVPTR